MKYCFRKPELLQNLRVYENGELNRAAIMAFHPDPEKWVIGAYTKIGYFANDADILFKMKFMVHCLLKLKMQWILFIQNI